MLLIIYSLEIEDGEVRIQLQSVKIKNFDDDSVLQEKICRATSNTPNFFYGISFSYDKLCGFLKITAANFVSQK